MRTSYANGFRLEHALLPHVGTAAVVAAPPLADSRNLLQRLIQWEVLKWHVLAVNPKVSKN
jgi:hypothetical protein